MNNKPNMYENNPRPTMSQAISPGDCVKRNPILPLLLNDLNQATIQTLEIVEKLEVRFSSVVQPLLPTPEKPSGAQDREPLPAALDMARDILRRVHLANDRLRSLDNRAEV